MKFMTDYYSNENTLKSGTTLRGKSYTYTIQKVLGQGTFGITYLATTQVKVTGALGELETTIQVAIKEFFMKEINGREDYTVTSGSKGGVYDKYKQKFAREAENLSKLHHPNIVKVLEYFEANNTVYYAMEYMEGGSLDNYITQKNGMPEAECVKYAKQIGAALSYMHAHKMLHLDLKPGNVMLRKNGEAVLIDFGLSKQYDENGNPETSTTVGGGTHGYAPIEQANYHDGKGFPVTMDVYALGATMYKMLTGERAPEASDILNEGFPAYKLQEAHVSDNILASIAKAMASHVKQRYQTISEFIETLNSTQTIQEKSQPVEKPQPQPDQHQTLSDTLPIGYSIQGKKHLYKITSILGKDDCSNVYTVVMDPTPSGSRSPQKVTLVEMYPHAFMGGRVIHDNRTYEMDYSLGDYTDLSDLFTKKINTLIGLGAKKIDVDQNINSDGSQFVSFQGILPNTLLQKALLKRELPLSEPHENDEVKEENNEVKKENEGCLKGIINMLDGLGMFIFPLFGWIVWLVVLSNLNSKHIGTMLILLAISVCSLWYLIRIWKKPEFSGRRFGKIFFFLLYLFLIIASIAGMIKALSPDNI